MRRPIQLIALFGILMTACAAPVSPPRSAAESAAPVAQGPKKISAVIRSDPKTLAVVNAAPGASEVLQLLRSGLTVLDDSNVLQAQLAESVPTVENGLWVLGSDGSMDTTWKIRKGAAWHDGTPLSADDLAFAVDVGTAKEVAILGNVGYSFLDKVTAIDSQTIKAHWKQPFINADTLFSGEFAAPLPKHLLSKAFADNKAAFADLPYWSTEFVGTGAYKLKDWAPSSQITLVANDGYVLGRPKIDQIDVKMVPDPNTLTAAILADSADLALGRSLSLDQATQLRDQWKSGHITISLSGRIAIVPQFLNPDPAVIGDVRFRRALVMATNRQEMADALQAGLSQPADSFLDPDQADYAKVDASVPRYPYDLNRAAALMQELGYSRGPNNAWRDSAGKPLNIEMRTSQGDDLQEKALFSTADNWNKFGVATDTVIVPPQRQTDREYRATRGGFELYRQPADLANIADLHGSQTPTAENSYAGRNRSRYQNAQFDALLDKYFVTIPKADRIQIVGQLIYQISDQLTIMGLFHNVSPGIQSNRLQNVGKTRPSWNAHLWDVA